MLALELIVIACQPSLTNLSFQGIVNLDQRQLGRLIEYTSHISKVNKPVINQS